MFNTNGWFIDKDLANEIKKTGVNHVRISIDGATPEIHDAIRGVRGSFRKALEALENLKQVGIPLVGITPTVMPDNFHQVGEIIDLAVKYGVDEIQLVQICATGRGKNINSLSFNQLLEIRRLVKEKLKEYNTKINLTATEGILANKCEQCIKNGIAIPSFMGCSGGRTCAAINEEGKVTPCILYRVEAGDLRKETFSKIWHSSPTFIERREIRGACLKCRFSDTCVRGCPLEEFVSEEDIKQFIEKENISTKPSGCFNGEKFFCSISLQN
jgi:radical SAM protein with 4Fe4S-binding SPASM domain